LRLPDISVHHWAHPFKTLKQHRPYRAVKDVVLDLSVTAGEHVLDDDHSHTQAATPLKTGATHMLGA